jgi:hypothetical protein
MADCIIKKPPDDLSAIAAAVLVGQSLKRGPTAMSSSMRSSRSCIANRVIL